MRIITFWFFSSLVLTACTTSVPAAIPTHTGETRATPPVSIPEQEPITTPLSTVLPSVEIPTETIAPISMATVPKPSPSATKVYLIPGLIGPVDYGDRVNPLTGQIVENPEVLARRPIAIKISNNARVRPQAGINNADLVFEHLTEGGITRLTAIFYGQDSSKVGSIRSGRLIDLELPIMYDAAFAYSGSSAPLRLMFLRSIFYDRIISPDFAHGGFERISNPSNPNERVEDTLYTDTFLLRWMLGQRELDTPPNIEAGMSFHPDPPEGGQKVNSVEILYPATSVYWYYSPNLGGYLRWSDGIQHLDANTGSQLFFNNIVVVKAPHLDTEIIEDSGGSPSIQIQMWGEGPVYLYRNGLRFDGEWRRLDSRKMLTFYTEEGDILPLAPGKTFFQIVTMDFSDIFERP